MSLDDLIAEWNNVGIGKEVIFTFTTLGCTVKCTCVGKDSQVMRMPVNWETGKYADEQLVQLNESINPRNKAGALANRF